MNFNIKRLSLFLTIIMIASFSLSIIFFAGSGVTWAEFWSFNNLNESNPKYKDSINREELFGLEDIHRINVNTVSSNINFLKEDRDDIKVVFNGHMASSANTDLPIMITEKTGNTLDVRIKYPSGINFGVSSLNINIDIFLPEDFSRNIDIKTTSGNVNVDELDINTLYFNTVSGSLRAEKLYTEQSTTDTTSGNIKINNFKGSLDHKSISGDLNVIYTEFHNDIKIKTTSGDNEIRLPEDSDFYLSTKSVSGDINCEFPLTLEGKIDKKNIIGRVGEGINNISASTVSGDVSIIR